MNYPDSPSAVQEGVDVVPRQLFLEEKKMIKISLSLIAASVLLLSLNGISLAQTPSQPQAPPPSAQAAPRGPLPAGAECWTRAGKPGIYRKYGRGPEVCRELGS
jgi:hypothetical protein